MKRQTIEMKSMMNIHVIEIEAKRMKNIQLIVYRIAQVIQMTDKTSENGMKMIV
jgi:hypothetical protein